MAESMALRVGLREVINHLPNLGVVVTGGQDLELRAGLADVLVVVPPMDLTRLSEPQAILLLTDDPAEVQQLQSTQSGAWGALPINTSEDELEIAIRAVAEGLWIGAPGLLRGLFNPRPQLVYPRNEDQAVSLTDREIEVLQLATQGLANKQMASLLEISEHTIKFHLSAIYSKLGVSSRTEAVRSGVRSGLVVL
jgi:NarL family two-component system response regulator YdfI